MGTFTGIVYGKYRPVLARAAYILLKAFMNVVKNV